MTKLLSSILIALLICSPASVTKAESAPPNAIPQKGENASNRISGHGDFTTQHATALAQAICGHYIMFSGDELISYTLFSIKDSMTEVAKIPTPSKADMINFLNTYKDYMYCQNGYPRNTYYAHYLHSAYENNDHRTMLSKLFTSKKYLYLEDGPKIDMNVVSFLGEHREPATTVDYLDRLSQKAYRRALTDIEINGLELDQIDDSEKRSLDRLKKRIIKKLGAKSFKDFPANVRARYEATAACINNKGVEAYTEAYDVCHEEHQTWQ